MALNKTRISVAVFVAAAALVAVGVRTGMLSGKADAKVTAAKPSPLVSVVRAESHDLPVKLTAQGHVVPLNQIDVRPHASGTIRGVHFHEGDEVKAGQLMFSIDASDAISLLERVTASAAQIEAQVDDAERELARTKELAKAHF
jgi:multidrug efflux pump subunit AcrA (membrane-fusion protein)